LPVTPTCRLAAVAVGAFASAVACRAADWPDVPPPPRAIVVEWVAQDMKVNGLPSRIERFESELTVPELIEFYRAQWARLEPAPKARSLRDWSTISALRGKVQMVVQARARSPQGSEGMISLMDFGRFEKNFVPGDLPRWSDTRILQVTDTVDGPRRSRLVAMQSSSSFEIVQTRWREEWSRRGYALVGQRTTPAADGTQTWLATFDKTPHTVDMAVAWRNDERSTQITANLVSPAEAATR
jgi:hypothetical protein